MAALQKKNVSIFTGSVTYQFNPHPHFNPPIRSLIPTPWFSQGTFQEAGLFLRLILEKGKTGSRAVLQICTMDQRTQLEASEHAKGTTAIKLDVSPTVVLVPAVELSSVQCRWSCCGTYALDLPALKPTLLKLPLVVEIESKPANTNTTFHACKTHGNTYGGSYSFTFEAHFRTSSAVLHPLAFLGRLHGGLLSDVTLRVKTKELRAHRCVLAAVSEVFRNMFEGDRFQEGSDGVVDVKDVRVEVMEAALRHVYGLELGEVDANTVVELLILAERYQLLELKALCEDLLSRDTSLDALELLAVADTHRAHGLKEALIKRIASSTNKKDILSEESAKKVVRSNPEAVVELLMRF